MLPTSCRSFAQTQLPINIFFNKIFWREEKHVFLRKMFERTTGRVRRIIFPSPVFFKRVQHIKITLTLSSEHTRRYKYLVQIS
uniref:Uncharacterized protein n=1 Tax=Marseillevirus sp. TaxID=2809551 RepID=A0AA96J2Z5_9VIRU|nr:hypothetical protein MarFTMF_149 [Marseillevirus sp.]